MHRLGTIPLERNCCKGVDSGGLGGASAPPLFEQ